MFENLWALVEFSVLVCVQLFKRRNVATADEETEEEVMSDGGFHETQMNNMEMTSVSGSESWKFYLGFTISIVPTVILKAVILHTLIRNYCAIYACGTLYR